MGLAEREAGSMHWEPDAGFDPRSPGSRPGPKADAQPLSHPGIPMLDFLSFFKDFIYLFMRDTERERQRHRQREKQALCREPDAGLDPRSPGSHPGLQVALNHCATRAALFIYFLRESACVRTRERGRGRGW